MLQASLYTALLLPELNLGRNPYYTRLGEWYAHLMPPGIQRLSFGDYAATPARHWGTQRNNARLLTWLTGDGRFRHRWEELARRTSRGLASRPWLDLLAADRFTLPAATPDTRTCAVFPEAGWVMVSSQPHSVRGAFEKAVGMVFPCRPRGGFSHSYRAENDFVWYAFGQTLSAGGGGTAYPDPHSRHSISHNVILVNGTGQEWQPRAPAHPFAGRLIAYREGDGYVHWAGDATHAYQTVPGLLRWHRHVVFVRDAWFAVFDDLAVRPDAEPARFSWLFHVAPETPLAIAPDGSSFSYHVEDVHALVSFGQDRKAIEIKDLPGRDGFRNPVTGEDLYGETVKRLKGKNRDLSPEQVMAHNVWVTNRAPARAWCLLTALTAWRRGQTAPRVSFTDGRTVTVAGADGRSRSVSFDPSIPADIVIDLKAVRGHAAATEPQALPAGGPAETVRIGGDEYEVSWLRTERFDEPDWLSRWFVEGTSEVRARDGRLRVRTTDPKTPNVATIWYRTVLPPDVFIRFRATAVPPAEKNAANLNLFLHARERDGSPVRFGRSGQYKEYHAIPNYIVTFVGGYRDGWSRARRDPGFNLLHEAEVRSEVGQEYTVTVTMHKGRLRYYLDGKLIHDVTDEAPIPGGRFALRTWSTNAWWDDVEFGRILR
jgi:hypothetical protein